MRLTKPWTMSELRELRERYPHEHNADLVAEFGRSENAIIKFARRNGLKKSPGLLSKIPALIRERRQA